MARSQRGGIAARCFHPADATRFMSGRGVCSRLFWDQSLHKHTGWKSSQATQCDSKGQAVRASKDQTQALPASPALPLLTTAHQAALSQVLQHWSYVPTVREWLLRSWNWNVPVPWEAEPLPPQPGHKTQQEATLS